MDNEERLEEESLAEEIHSSKIEEFVQEVANRPTINPFTLAEEYKSVSSPFGKGKTMPVFPSTPQTLDSHSIYQLEKPTLPIDSEQYLSNKPKNMQRISEALERSNRLRILTMSQLARELLEDP